MNHQTLSKRLATVASFVPSHARLADIGSDHAYLPVVLMLQNHIDFAVAGEVVEGPYNSAKDQVVKDGLTDKISVRLADGLDAIQPSDEINVVTICGMGGSLIRDILEDGKRKQKLSGKERLILQPNIGERSLRKWLTENNYQIIDELIIEENKKIYEIIVAEKYPDQKRLSFVEQLMGPCLLQEQTLVFKKKWQRELTQRKSVIAAMNKAKSNQTSRLDELQKEIQTIEEVLGNGDQSKYIH